MSGGTGMLFRLRRNGVFLILGGTILGTILLGLRLLLLTLDNNQMHTQTPINPTSKIIIDENAQTGTDGWKIPVNDEASIQIQAYADTTSVWPGQTLTFYVSTLNQGTVYSLDIYRLGWYGSLGGRLMFSMPKQIGAAQGYYNANSHQLVNCSSCYSDKQTGLVEANWHPSIILRVPADWVTGVYLAKFTDVQGMETSVPFDVRGDTDSLYVAVTSDTTYAAYNDWGGYSLYDFNSLEINGVGRGVKVSFDRPYSPGYGSAYVLNFEADAIHWLERQGYDISYMSSVDLHQDPNQLLQHRAYLSLGHDEYWTKEMRDGVEHARNLGVGLAFLGANASYWQMRFEPDSAGVPDRTIVCYKVETQHHDLARDPLYGKDNTRVTSLWRDPVLTRPENALIGIMYSEFTSRQRGFPWQLDAMAKSLLLNGTGLQAGQQYGCGLVGYEWDRVFNNGTSPVGLQVLGASHTIDDNNNKDISNTTYYIAQSGAMVFATGSTYWTTALDGYRYRTDKICDHQDSVVPGMQRLMEHVMAALLIKRQFEV